MTERYPLDIPRTESGRDHLKACLQQWAELAAPGALKVLDLQEQIQPEFPWPNQPKYEAAVRREDSPCRTHCAHFRFPEARPRARPSGQRVENLELLRQVGCETLARVYKGEMPCADGGAPVPVVAKVYQNSISAWRGHLYAKRFPRSLEHAWTRILCAYKIESWAYERMHALQGIVVPHVYGFFKVVLPSGEPAVVLLREYIEAGSVPNLKETPISTRETFDSLVTAHPTSPPEVHIVDSEQALGMVAATHAVASCGVHTADFARPHVKWPGHHGTVRAAAGVGIPGVEAPLPALLDFGDAVPLKVQYEKRGMIIRSLRAVCRCTVYEDVAGSWWREAFSAQSFICSELEIYADRAEKDLYDKMAPKANSLVWTGVVERPGPSYWQPTSDNECMAKKVILVGS